VLANIYADLGEQVKAKEVAKILPKIGYPQNDALLNISKGAAYLRQAQENIESVADDRACTYAGSQPNISRWATAAPRCGSSR
jgi:hypothetical protein